MARSILLIDDKVELLKELEEKLRAQFKPEEANVISWVPKHSTNPAKEFEAFLAKGDLGLVVTDYDLTEGGLLGFFGATVVDWCQIRAIPVGDFSRGHVGSLPQEPNLFEIRVPVTSHDDAARFIASVHRGFELIRVGLTENPTLLKRRSPSSALAALLGAKNDESQFAQYGTRYGGANSALMDRFSETTPKNKTPSASDKAGILSYIIGHLLLNAVLRFPGPILHRAALTAYLGVALDESETVHKYFSEALYEGPFSTLGPHYWKSKIDSMLLELLKAIPSNQEVESTGEMHRKGLEVALKRKLKAPVGCERCSGRNGGFLCPFTNRTVCERPDCSVVSNVWIPQGARLCRIERDFYDEWAPILGM